LGDPRFADLMAHALRITAQLDSPVERDNFKATAAAVK
jgi:hypothetical protein